MSGASYSLITPLSSTITLRSEYNLVFSKLSKPSKRDRTHLSLSKTVFIRCAIVSTVQSLNAFRIVSCISVSVSKSIEAVASSRIKTFVFRSRARARHISCRCPILEKYTFSLSLHYSATDVISSSEFRRAAFKRFDFFWLSIGRESVSGGGPPYRLWLRALALLNPALV